VSIVLLWAILVTWRSKKQIVVARSSIGAEYRAIAHTIYELIWIQLLLSEMGVVSSQSMVMHCDNQLATYIANNPMFHERTKHF